MNWMDGLYRGFWAQTPDWEEEALPTMTEVMDWLEEWKLSKEARFSADHQTERLVSSAMSA